MTHTIVARPVEPATRARRAAESRPSAVSVCKTGEPERGFRQESYTRNG
jgi:hypothetical protein